MTSAPASLPLSGPPASAIVIGAGIVGLATALRLQERGVSVTIIDREGPAGGASYGNGAILTSAGCVPVAVPGLIQNVPKMWLDRTGPLFLRLRDMPGMAGFFMRFPRECRATRAREVSGILAWLTAGTLEDHRALAGDSPAATHIKDTPYLYVWRDKAAFEADRFGWPLRRELGFTWSEVTGQALRDRAPLMADGLDYGIIVDGSGKIDDPGAYCHALAKVFESRGGRLIRAEVKGFDRAPDGRVQGVRIADAQGAGETLAADATVIAAGIQSRELAAKLGLKVPMIAERGYHIELINPSHHFDVSLMIASGRFVLTQLEGRIRLAGLVEVAAADAPMNKAAITLLEDMARTYFPELHWEETRAWVGARPSPVDSLPLLGPVPDAAGAFCAFGHHHIGLTTGPRTGEMLAGLICGERSNTDLTPFDPARFTR